MRLSELQEIGVGVYGDIGFRGECPAERVEMATFFNRLRREFPITWGRLALHPRNEQMLRGGQHQAIVRHRAEGMTPGAADIIIPAARAFVCEMKRQDHTKSRWQPGQAEYLIEAYNKGAFACVGLGADGAWQALEEWLAIH